MSTAGNGAATVAPRLRRGGGVIFVCSFMVDLSLIHGVNKPPRRIGAICKLRESQSILFKVSSPL
jgi:hypothetical protein